jgi:hypothetical protein
MTPSDDTSKPVTAHTFSDALDLLTKLATDVPQDERTNAVAELVKYFAAVAALYHVVARGLDRSPAELGQLADANRERPEGTPEYFCFTWAGENPVVHELLEKCTSQMLALLNTIFLDAYEADTEQGVTFYYSGPDQGVIAIVVRD